MTFFHKKKALKNESSRCESTQSGGGQKAEEEKRVKIIITDNQNFIAEQTQMGKKINLTNFFLFLAGEERTEVYFYYYPGSIIKADSIYLNFLRFVHRDLWVELRAKKISFLAFPSDGKDQVDKMIIRDLPKIIGDRAESISEVIMISGDRDFYEILRDAQIQGIKVRIIAGKNSISKKFEKLADEFLCLSDILKNNPQLILDNGG